MFLNSAPAAYGKPGRGFALHISLIVLAIAHLVKLVHVFAGIYV